MKNENFRVSEREELAQEEKYDQKTRGPELQQMPEEGEENEKVCESDRTTARKQETDRGQQTISRGKYFFQRQGHGQFITFEVKTERSYRREILAGSKNLTETNRS